MISNLSNTINSYKEKTNNNEEIKAILLFKCGFDGSSNHSIYNINVKEQMDEGNIIAVFICPLKLYIINDGTILWNNNSPNSPKFCRPLRLWHKNETKENLKLLYEDLKMEITTINDRKHDNQL